MLEGLRGEGEALPFVLFALSERAASRWRRRDGRSARFKHTASAARGGSMARRCAASRRSARARASPQAAAIDRAIKGVGSGEPWEAVQLTLGLELHDLARAA